MYVYTYGGGYSRGIGYWVLDWIGVVGSYVPLWIGTLSDILSLSISLLWYTYIRLIMYSFSISKIFFGLLCLVCGFWFFQVFELDTYEGEFWGFFDSLMLYLWD